MSRRRPASRRRKKGPGSTGASSGSQTALGSPTAPAAASPPIAPDPGRLDFRLCLVALAVAALLGFFGLSNHHFWDDEANTALFARNLLQTGHLDAWDGNNLIGYRLGAELDENLRNVYMPPAQYWLAALGLWAFGPTTWGGRVPFLLLGLASVGVLVMWVRWHLPKQLPGWLPACLLAISPAYLLYIRQCRYYSVLIFASLALLAAYAHPKTTRRATLWAWAVGGASAVLLMFTHTMGAAALAATLPIFLLEPAYRKKPHLLFLGIVYSLFLLSGSYVLLTANPFAASVAKADPVTGLAHCTTLLRWHLFGLGEFEFFPLLLLMPLVLPWLFDGMKSGRPLAKSGWLLVLVLLAYSLVITVFSPQPVGLTRVADMRHVVPLIPIGAAVSALALWLLWACCPTVAKPLAVVVALLATTTNSLHLGYLANQRLGSTLYRYLDENFRDYATPTDTNIAYLASLAPGKVVQFFPDYMAYSPQFYVPQHHYCCQLAPDHRLRPELKSQLPAYVFDGKVRPDIILAGHDAGPRYLQQRIERLYGKGSYRLTETLPGYWRERSRPEIPLRNFGRADPRRQQGFVVWERTAR